MLNSKRSDFYLLGDITLQNLSIQIDSVKRYSNLLDFSSVNSSKSYISIGPGIEYVFKSKNEKPFRLCYGIRASYNFYINESEWEKAGNKKFRQFNDDDIGNLQVMAFMAYRFSPKLNPAQ